MDLLEVRIHQSLYVLVLVCMMFCNAMSETHQDHSVKDIDMVVGLRAICRRGPLFSAQTDIECHEELGHKMRSVVGQKIDRNPVQDDTNNHKNVCLLRRGYCNER